MIALEGGLSPAEVVIPNTRTVNTDTCPLIGEDELTAGGRVHGSKA